MSKSVTIDFEDHVAQVTLNRPEKQNAVSLEMFADLADAGQQLREMQSLRAVVLTGAGANFCAGIDVDIFSQKEMVIDATALAPLKTSPANLFQQAAYIWRELPVPVICAIKGVAYGAGLQIALGADLRYASTDARLSIMEIKWGLIPDMAISTTLRDILPADRVKEMAWSGRTITGEEAFQMGLVTANHDDPLAAAQQTAADIAARSPEAIQATKQLVNSAWRLSDEAALALEAKLQLAVLGSANQREAVVANIEKRKPRFKD
jgi:enoyl-CoA hydratase/carnithine racemase